MSEIGGRLGCTRVIRGEVCDKPKLHGIHVGSSMEHEYRKPERKKRREQMASKSDARIEYLEESDYAARSAEARGKPCAVQSPVCTKVATGLHHILSRGAAGGLEAAERLGPKPIPACDECNEYVERAGRQWALDNGFKETLKGRVA